MIVPDAAASRTTAIDDIVVVVPACDEERWLGGCLDALARSARHIDVPVRVLVVLDACTDGSAAIVRAAGADSVAVSCRSVGAARAAGFAVARGRGDRTWFATTDADSRVDPLWLERQLTYARGGYGVVAGVVTVADWHGYRRDTRRRYELRYQAGWEAGHRHVHGANLGFRADSYWHTGGFADLATGEDVEFVGRAQARGERVAWARDVVVATSARRIGRAPAGFAAHLRGLQGESSPGSRAEGD
ncbi:glycosyltransferase [Nocardia sp. NPDC004722]